MPRFYHATERQRHSSAPRRCFHASRRDASRAADARVEQRRYTTKIRWRGQAAKIVDVTG